MGSIVVWAALLPLASGVDFESVYGTAGTAVLNAPASAEIPLWPAGKPAPGDEGHTIRASSSLSITILPFSLIALRGR